MPDVMNHHHHQVIVYLFQGLKVNPYPHYACPTPIIGAEKNACKTGSRPRDRRVRHVVGVLCLKGGEITIGGLDHKWLGTIDVRRGEMC